MLWDIFCRVIDNFGDIGVCWRLSSDLAQRGEQVRLWVDDSSALEWMAPGANAGSWPGIQVMQWQESTSIEVLDHLTAADVWIEAFGCEISHQFVDHFGKRLGGNTKQQPVWINLEYLSAEPFVERAHALPSPVMHGPAKGWTKHFFYPGFTDRTGGLLREPDLAERQKKFDLPDAKDAWLANLGLTSGSDSLSNERMISLFCYEPAALATLIVALAQDTRQSHLLVTPGRATAAVRLILGSETRRANMRISYLPPLTQPEFDELLWHCDINFVRGEDSLVRAIWAGKPFVWHIYPQEDGAHIAKLQAFLNRMGASPSTRALHEVWNAGVKGSPEELALTLPPMSAWQDEASALKSELWKLPELTGNLLQFVRKNR